VVVPIVIITLLVLFGKHYVQRLMSKSAPELEAQKENAGLQRSRMVRANGKWLPKESFSKRQSFFIDAEDGFLIKHKRDAPPANPMMDPKNMNQMMMGNMSNMIPMIGVGYIINLFFAGFVAIRVPFPLTIRFKGMLQRGIETQLLSSSWVSAASFYFLCLTGTRGIFGLFMSADPDFDEMRMMQQQMGQGPAMQDPGKAFVAEKEMMDMSKHKFELDNIEREFLTSSSEFLARKKAETKKKN